MRIDPKRMKVVKRSRLPDQIWDVTFGAGSVWATETNLGYVVRISARTNRMRHRFQLPRGVQLGNLRFGGGAVWVGQQYGDRIFRIDVSAGRVSSVRVGRRTALRGRLTDRHVGLERPRQHGLAHRPGDAQGRGDDSGRGKPRQRRGGRRRDGVRAQRPRRDRLSIDPATDTVVDTIAVGAKPFPAAWAFGDVWVPSYGGRTSTASTSAERRPQPADAPRSRAGTSARAAARSPCRCGRPPRRTARGRSRATSP